MLKIITMLTMLATALLAQAQVSQERTTASFAKIEITDGMELVFTQSSQVSLTAEAADAAELENIITEIDGNTLKISAQVTDKKWKKVYVSANGIQSIKAGSKSIVTLTNQLQSNQLNIALASASIFSGNIKSDSKVKLELESGSLFNGDIQARQLSGTFSGGSKASLSGNAIHTEFDARTASSCDAKNLVSETLSVNAGGFASVTMNPRGKSEIHIDGNASVAYWGAPQKANLQEDMVLVYGNNTPKGN